MYVTDAVHKLQKTGTVGKMFPQNNRENGFRKTQKMFFVLSTQKNMFDRNYGLGLHFFSHPKKGVEIVNRIGYLHKSTLN